MLDADDLSDVRIRIPLGMLNRHGLVAGATGTGKTKTLQLLAEQLSANGVPVFAADIKGDLSGIASPGEPSDKLTARTASVGQEWTATGFPTEFYALGGQGVGVPVRATMTRVRPDPAREGARPERDAGVLARPGLPLRRQAGPAAARPRRPARGRCSTSPATSRQGRAEGRSAGSRPQTAGVILRELIAFEDQGADVFFGEPEFETKDFLRTADGRPRHHQPRSSCPTCRTGPRCSRPS